MFWSSLLATMSLIYQTMLRDLIPNYIISTHTTQISHLSNLLNFQWNVQDKGFRPWVQQRPWSFLHIICWAIHVMSGSWMLLGGSLNSGNFETFLSPLLLKVVAGWLVSVQVEGDWGGCHARFRVWFLYSLRWLVFVFLRRLLQGPGRLSRGEVLWLTNLHRRKVSTEAWVSQIQFRTWCFKLEVSVCDGILGTCLAGAF